MDVSLALRTRLTAGTLKMTVVFLGVQPINIEHLCFSAPLFGGIYCMDARTDMQWKLLVERKLFIGKDVKGAQFKAENVFLQLGTVSQVP